MRADNRYFVRSPDGESITGYDRLEAAERAAKSLGENAHAVDTMAPVYVPMIQRVVDGELQILGVGGWGADPAVTDPEGVTALGLASERRATEIIAALEQALGS